MHRVEIEEAVRENLAFADKCKRNLATNALALLFNGAALILSCVMMAAGTSWSFNVLFHSVAIGAHYTFMTRSKARRDCAMERVAFYRSMLGRLR